MTESNVDNKGLIVGLYENEELTPLGQQLNEKTNGHLLKSVKLSDTKGKVGDSLVLYDVTPEVPRVAIVGLGKKEQTPSVYEKNENTRRAVGSGVKALKSKNASNFTIDSSIGCSKHTAEGAYLSNFKFDYKTSGKPNTTNESIEVTISNESTESKNAFNEGKIFAESQNFARTLMEMPANLLTPTIFVETVKKQFKHLIDSGKVEMIVRDEQWAKDQKMGMFLGVAQGSEEPLKFLELHYKGASADGKDSIVYVGKGITFDSGGISIKPSAGMGLMKGDMGGAASAVSSMFGVASLGLKVNLITLTPLCENMPSGKATKPGDVHIAMNGKTVEIDNTDAEGRLILGDALHYAHTFKPSTILDMATLTGAIDVALGQHYAGVFAGTDGLWDELNECGNVSGDRMWRMPLLPEYRKQLDSKIADIVNSAGRSGGACSAAMFLKDFVTIDRWAHLDIAGVMSSSEDGPYIKKGMTGKPVRALIEFAKKHQQQ
ncbi:hypothetical protein DICPUDRAFT_91370 [Dictyostelium purpureum]|uniref:Cytosol aminopeptidase domain-containing protein n=1 Tax=Dictyostelium purpureum TaxID=5786 RepID=F0ZB91_DICPU|nr:uncharacterized protein DICPUDRAFT_91370 [Dictyostelium purpureum]EGC38800.1 hypothetical protein DICPUDRAFT_91370 [Dictyostelium purpureum]|eukprot:XP_003284694.1 hypothetical protein DICPUDRAFT_91370 [Dictyostelium purpureum]